RRGAHREPLAQFGRLVYVDFDQLDQTRHLRRDLLKRRTDGPAGHAPSRPQVDNHGKGGAVCDLSEIVVDRVHDPGQRRMAGATAQTALGSCRHTVLAATAWTRDYFAAISETLPRPPGSRSRSSCPSRPLLASLRRYVHATKESPGMPACPGWTWRAVSRPRRAAALRPKPRPGAVARAHAAADDLHDGRGRRRGGADACAGSGLRGIERRMSAFDGRLDIASPPGGPTIVTMELPCASSSPKTSPSSGTG